ncbi:hypothetical protein N7486_009485 [Penicillium sp. IBT 16267x]|nr:hypothetical protein N7486_009485 [Penicillium sp. IBT 16267x]
MFSLLSGTNTPQSSRASPTGSPSDPTIIFDKAEQHAAAPAPAPAQRRRRIVVAMTGATGAILGIKVLIALRRLNIETHLVMSKWAEATIKYETDYHQPTGSFKADGMIVVPCSMKTLAAIHSGFCDDLISRTADVMLKERRRLVLVARETPLSDIHLRNMLEITRSGAIIFPRPPGPGLLYPSCLGG